LRRKILPGKNPLCVCGHRYISHHYHDSIGTGYGPCKVKDEKLDRKFNSPYCSCDKFLDRRHCKIKENDSVLHILTRHKRTIDIADAVWYDYEELTEYSGVSRPTVSRRCNLFLLLGLVDRMWSWGGIEDVMNFRINWLIYDHLRKEGIII